MIRVTENRAKELAILPEIDAAAVANALWHTRCALAVAPQDTTAAFPGVRCYTAVQATVARRPPLRPGTGGDVLASAACLSTTDSHVCGAGGHDVSRVFNESTGGSISSKPCRSASAGNEAMALAATASGQIVPDSRL